MSPAKSRKKGAGGGSPPAKAKPAAGAGIESGGATPFEESDGFQIFKASPGPRKRAAPPAAEVPVAEVPAGNRPAPDSAIAERMAGAIRSIVQDEVRRAVERVAQSAVRDAAAAGDLAVQPSRK